MSLTSNRLTKSLESLRPGLRLSQAEFHVRYEAMLPGINYELIHGEVSMASPVGPRHGKQTFHLSGWLFPYVMATPGVEGLDNTSVALDDQNEVQPGLLLRIESDRGRSQNLGGMITGAPELVVEVADSSRGSISVLSG